MVSCGRKATEGGEKQKKKEEGGEKQKKKEEEAAAAGDDEVKFIVMIMDTVDTVSPINLSLS